MAFIPSSLHLKLLSDSYRCMAEEWAPNLSFKLSHLVCVRVQIQQQLNSEKKSPVQKNMIRFAIKVHPA